MRKVFVATIVAAMAATAAPAVAQSGGADARSDANLTEEELDQVVCRRDTVVGSRVAKRRTCMTRREWIRTQNSVRDGVADYLRSGSGGADRTGG